MTKEIDTLAKWIADSDNIVFFGGAGVSTESNIPDFRSVDGLYNQKYAYPPETILSHTFFMRRTKEFYDFYRDKMIYESAKPNKAHLALVELEKQGKLKAIITQNIDGLHEMAGSAKVLNLHGTIYKNHCMRCNKFYEGVLCITQTDEIPMCECGGVIKPDVVLYEEGLDNYTISEAIKRISEADLLIVAGTSLTVYPAAGLLDYYRGNRLVLINKDATPRDSIANLIIHDKVGETLDYCVSHGE